MNDTIFDNTSVKRRLERLTESQNALATRPLVEDNGALKFRLQNYAEAKRELKETIKHYDQSAIKIRAMIQASITENVYNSIQTDVRTFVTLYESEAENPFGLENYPSFRAMWKALEKNYSPNISDALSYARQKFNDLPGNSSLLAIYNAVNHYVNEISVYPILDSTGNVTTDASGRTMYHTVDQHYMKDALLKKVLQSPDAAKSTLHTTWVTDDLPYSVMYEKLKAYVMRIPESSTAVVVPNPTSVTSLPTIAPATPYVNAALHNPHDAPPILFTPNATCKNCKRSGHLTIDCASTRCEDHQTTFNSLLERQKHAAKYHRSNYHHDRHYPRNYSHNDDHHRDRDQYRSDNRQYDDRRYDHRRPPSRDRHEPDQRSRSRDRNPDPRDHRRSQSPYRRSSDERRPYSPHPDRSSSTPSPRPAVSFANAAYAYDDSANTYDPANPHDEGYPYNRS